MDEYNAICFTKVIGVDDDVHAITPADSLSRALTENPRNGSLTTPDTGMGSAAPTDGPLQLAMTTRKFWGAGRELKIAFKSGSEWQKSQVKQYAPAWCDYANIKFKFVAASEPNIDILIDFNPSLGSWSRIGTDSTYYASKNDPSMNLGWIDQNKKPSAIRQVILHEFGHALGAVHEHESPYSTIPWNKDKVYQDLSGPPNNWDRAKIDYNMFTVYTLEEVQATAFDPASIMLYYFPPSWTTNNKGTAENTDLSPEDKSYIKFCYPQPAFDAGQFSTMEVRPANQVPQHNSQVEYYFEKYDAVPRLALGLTSLDFSSKANIRIKAEATEATKESFVVSLDSWSNSVFISGSLTWLEISAKRFGYLQTGTFSTTEVRPWSKPRAETSKRIHFATPFSAPPRVVVWLNALDISHDHNCRIKAYASNVDAQGFTLHLDSWADTIMYSSGATWIAYPADHAGVASGTFSTTDVVPWNKPKQEVVGKVAFPKAFKGTPKVIMALNYLDFKAGENTRARVSTSSVTSKDITWHLQTWSGSTMYAAAASYFAWQD